MAPPSPEKKEATSLHGRSGWRKVRFQLQSYFLQLCHFQLRHLEKLSHPVRQSRQLVSDSIRKSVLDFAFRRCCSMNSNLVKESCLFAASQDSRDLVYDFTNLRPGASSKSNFEKLPSTVVTNDKASSHRPVPSRCIVACHGSILVSPRNSLKKWKLSD